MIDIRSFLKDCVVSPEIADEFKANLGLEYIPEDEAEGRVCMAAHPDVRPEFRDTFTTSHLRYYIKAILNSNSKLPNNSLTVPYPANTTLFWELVQQGKDLK